MTSIWSFLLQSAAVSTTALLLLLVKWILADKLSPRWQYGVWAVLALRILIPANVANNMLPRLGIWLEAAKAAAEGNLASAFSGVYTPISPAHVLPWLSANPQSVTDWLFAVYAAGVVLSGLWHLGSYACLRLRLRKARPASPALTEKIANIRLQHWIKPWRTVEAPGIPSAFVCGVFRPLLVVSAENDVDEKVLLHELLHLKYRDALQSIFWTALRCLHWCNPFMHYVFNRIGNDMESLCDQRVLERLEGEERREYGQLLLTMANQRYARAPGTTSISNGSRNIARRIEAIVRFKRYPRGMALVSVCIIICLLSPTLIGTAVTTQPDDYQPATAKELSFSMAAARVRRCTTVAGAIDTYAKGILTGNGLYTATASPLEKHAALEAEMLADHIHDGSDLWRIVPGYGLEYLNPSKGYDIYDLVKQSDGSYHCHIAFCVSDFADPAHRNWPTDTNGVPIVEGAVVIPLRIFQENDAWVVEEREERILANIRFDQLEFYGDDLPWLLEKTVECETGTVTISHRITCGVDNHTTTNNLFWWSEYNYGIQPDATFEGGWLKCQYRYQLSPDSPIQPSQNACLEIQELKSAEELPELGPPISPDSDEFTAVTGGTNTGNYYSWRLTPYDGWDGMIQCGGGDSYDPEDYQPLPPAAYAIRITFDGQVVEEFIVGGFEHGET